MSIRHLLKYASSLSPGVVLRKASALGARSMTGWTRTVVERNRSTFEDPVHGPLAPSMLSKADLAGFAEPSTTLERMSAYYLEHRFDVLGSGWVEVTYGLDRQSLLNSHHTPHWPDESLATMAALVSSGNRARAREIRRLIGAGYRPIDWQRDLKSGHRWREDRRSECARWGHLPGVDIKVPWELARLHHLPQLALRSLTARGSAASVGAADPFAAEYRNQVLDFVAANPPGYGVNWCCTMDVAIRAANLVLAFDLFRLGGHRFDDAFVAEFHATVLAHGRHIIDNLEWHETNRANHYLADLVGLLFVAAWLPAGPESDLWLGFAATAFLSELDRQFLADGTSFEASTNYHRLSAEMAVYGAALVLGLDPSRRRSVATVDPDRWTRRPRIDGAALARFANGEADADECLRRLERAAEFTIHATKPDGAVVQVGDTDNGRLFKLAVGHVGRDLVEIHLDHRAFVAAAAGLFDRPDFREFCGSGFRAETALVEALARGTRLKSAEERDAAESRCVSLPWPSVPTERVHRTRLELPDPAASENLTAVAYPEFGLFVWRGQRFFLSIRCGPIGPTGPGVHAHNDQLALELQVDGVDWARDPGTYLYTPDPVARDRYRSHLAHAVPRFETAEPSRLDLGMFALEDNANARCIRFDATGFHGLHTAYGAPLFRRVDIEPGCVTVTDGFGGTEPSDGAQGTDVVVRSADDLKTAWGLVTQFSPGYGSLA